MTLTLSDYFLTDMPFIDISTLNPYSRDVRLNGQVFIEDGSKPKLEKMLNRIKNGETITYVSSTTTTKGTGKSAMMAAAYWQLEDKKRPALWTSIQGGRTSNALVGRILDSAIKYGFVKKIIEKIKDPSESNLSKIIDKYEHPPSPGIVGGLVKVLEATDWEMAAKLSRIKVSIANYGPIEVFGYFLYLVHSAFDASPTIFIDQFEDYVQAQFGTQNLQRLSDDWRSLLEACRQKASLVVSIHDEAEGILRSLPNSRLAPVNPLSRIIIDPITEDQGIRLTAEYMKHFRPPNYKNTKLYPFEDDCIQYLVRKTAGNPRYLIAALRQLLISAAERDTKAISLKFVKTPEVEGSIFVAGPVPS